MMRFGKGIGTVVAACVFLAACATSNVDQSTLSPAEKRLREQADTFNQTVVEGAVAGCAVGLLVGLLAAGNGSRGQGAAIGCAAGAAMGGATGYYIADKQEQYANEEARLDSMTDDVRKDNQRLADMIATSRQVIAEDSKTLEGLNQKVASGKMSKEKARQELARIDENTQYMQKTLAKLKEKHEEYVQARAQTEGSAKRTQAMDGEIAKLEKQIAQLEGDINGLMQRRQVARIG